MKGKFFRAAALSLLLVSLVSGAAAADVSIDVRDTEGDDLNNFDLIVTGEDTDIDRESVDRADLELDEGEYDLELSKNGYEDLERTIFVEEDEDSSYRFTMQRTDQGEDEENIRIDISDLEAPESVCRGESFPATARIENNADEDRAVSMTGSGFGQILLGNSFVVESGESVRYRFIFTGADELGSQEIRMSARSGTGSDSTTRTVEVTSCSVPGDPASVSSIDMQLYPLGGNNRAFVGEVVRVKGFADGSRGKVPLDLSVDGEKVADITTDQRGYYTSYFRPEKAGEVTVTVSAEETSKSRTLGVEPAPSVGNLRAEEKVFSGDRFEICGDVNSVITPKVVLLENGEVIESRLSKGEVCFDITAPSAGEYSYEMRVLTYGKGGSANIDVNVLEQGPEAESFPGQVATVESEPGILKISLYNTNNETQNYTARLENFPGNWVSDSEKTVSLGKGERDTVFFYVSPEKSGSFTSVLEVESGDEIIYSDSVEMSSADAHPGKISRSFVDNYVRLLMFFM
jgi:5-hydroxyisourate hydrolase-like protein (transthyretin family)